MKGKPNISIVGDGNAVGDNNRIIVDKRTYKKVVNQGGGGGGPTKPDAGGENAGPAVVFAGFAALIALAIAAWKFALYASVIYFWLLSSALLLGGCLATGLLVGIYKGVPWQWWAKTGMALASTVLVGIAVYWSRTAYRMDISDLASRATSWKGFMCGLSPYGQQLATLHMLSMAALAATCLVVLAYYTLGTMSASIFFMRGWLWCGRVAIVLNHPALLVSSAILAICCAASQTDLAAAVWEEAFTQRLSPMFSVTTTGFSLCK